MEEDKKGFFKRLKAGLIKTHDELNEKVVVATTRRLKVDEEMLEELEESLITADLGMTTTLELVGKLREATGTKEVLYPADVAPFLRKQIAKMVSVDESGETSLKQIGKHDGNPHVILMIGVNGAGKTTTIGKLANYYTSKGKSLLLAAGDTFRAAAIEQLTEWSNRVGCDIVKHQPNSDPSAVAFDAIKAGIARGKDIVIVDTAGRLHTRTNLMDELEKIKRIISRELPSAPHEVYLVLDGTSGQNGLNQAREFHEKIGITGLILTKLDGTSKGGSVIGIVNETKIPVKFIGIGEKIDDLQPFNPEEFAEAII